jgi:hypothetical protein
VTTATFPDSFIFQPPFHVRPQGAQHSRHVNPARRNRIRPRHLGVHKNRASPVLFSRLETLHNYSSMAARFSNHRTNHGNPLQLVEISS